MSDIAFEAQPLSRGAIREFATQVRAVIGFAKRRWIDVEEAVEFALPRRLPGFAYDIRETGEMGNNHGLAEPDNRLIILRRDVYDRACRGEGRDRMTVFHEVGHVLLHTKEHILLRRGTGRPKAYCNPEWQATAFAAELLVGHVHVQGCVGAGDLIRRFGVSGQAAEYQWRCLKEDGMV